jgi:hypothetical protein
LGSVRTVGLTALVLGLIDDLGDGTFDGSAFAEQFIRRGIVRGGRSGAGIAGRAILHFVRLSHRRTPRRSDGCEASPNFYLAKFPPRRYHAR